MLTKTPELAEQLIILRAIVGFLGEKHQFGWWDTNFLNDTGLKFLRIIFPRSAFAAGVNSVTEAARRTHDDRIGKGGVFHLFRLPPGLEQTIHERLSVFDPIEFLPHLKTKETALEKLRTYSNGNIKTSQGPIQIGTTREMYSLTTIKDLSKYYADAFDRNIQTFPYFTVIRND